MASIAILGAEIFGDRKEVELFAAAGREAAYYSGGSPLELAEQFAGVEALLVNLENVTGELLERLPGLKVVGRYGVGVDNIDLQAAAERGIAVINVPDYCADEVAEHAVSFIFAANRKLTVSAELTRRGVWGKVQELKPIQSIRDVTVGVIGTGRIGMKVIGMLAPFGTRIRIYDPYLANVELPPNAELTDLDTLYAESDIVTVHCPLTEQTRHMLGGEAFARMARKPAIVNVSRGPIIDERDLLKALDEGTVSFAALDVLETEPPPPDHPLLHHPRALVTNHIAWYSVQAERKLRELLCQRVTDYLEGRPVPTIANQTQLKERNANA